MKVYTLTLATNGGRLALSVYSSRAKAVAAAREYTDTPNPRLSHVRMQGKSEVWEVKNGQDAFLITPFDVE